MCSLEIAEFQPVKYKSFHRVTFVSGEGNLPSAAFTNSLFSMEVTSFQKSCRRFTSQSLQIDKDTHMTQAWKQMENNEMEINLPWP